jgi:hypothetical protein
VVGNRFETTPEVRRLVLDDHVETEALTGTSLGHHVPSRS